MVDQSNDQSQAKPENVELEREQLEEEVELEETGDAAAAPETFELEEVNALQNELAESRAKANEYLEGWQRTLADFSNYKKRIERDQAQVYQNAAGSIIKRYIQVLDDLDRALKNRPQDGDGAVWANGIELIYRKLLSILENEGVKPMGEIGEPFDPNLHEAVTSEESDEFESGQVIEVLQRGYLLGDRVLRPAMVRVAR